MGSKPTITVRVDPEVKAHLMMLAEENGLNLTEYMLELIKRNVNVTDYTFLDGACDMLVHISAGFHCAIKAPRVVMLGDGDKKDAQKICGVCPKARALHEKANKLNTLLKSGYQVEIPYCAKGGIVNPSLKTIHCPRSGFETQVTGCAKNCDYYRSVYADARLGKASPTK